MMISKSRPEAAPLFLFRRLLWYEAFSADPCRPQWVLHQSPPLQVFLDVPGWGHGDINSSDACLPDGFSIVSLQASPCFYIQTPVRGIKGRLLKSYQANAGFVDRAVRPVCQTIYGIRGRHRQFAYLEKAPCVASYCGLGNNWGTLKEIRTVMAITRNGLNNNALGVKPILLISMQVSDEIVYNLMKALFETVDNFLKEYSRCEFI